MIKWVLRKKGRTMALFDDLTKKAAKFTEKTIEKSS